ncbi:OLC1v1005947C2 [Oldenlandia corymbosa var. corymbosa]|uniref:OLC1v1005947C2 n=1 Tax=Oldenlandia corymbosa var. corymbosa TaxID=529605 RepID=A0AAV1DGH6_OLDCO|nr:OLC1v1005947C2 [Oldenlandia corymbosa var. corymbosa]
MMAATQSSFWCFALFSLYVYIVRGSFTIANEDRKEYIVYMGSLPSDPKYSPKSHHLSMLRGVVSSRSYTRSFNGFAALLTDKEAAKLSSDENVVSVFRSETLQLHTTESWDFMGFPENIDRNLTGEGEVIIGVLDTGIWPESPSFDDHGFGPVPKRWKGECQGGSDFKCNKKIIGARFYDGSTGGSSCRDTIGHGSHTASIAGGRPVKNTSFYGIAEGLARGGAPSARIAAYQVCSTIGCSTAGILGAFDDAVADGVDILSVSLGRQQPVSIEEDTIAIGAFHATEKGILVVQSAGNSGPMVGSTASNAPWLFSVAASTTNRKIMTKVVLGNSKVLEGYAVNSFKLKGSQVPVVYGAETTSDCAPDLAKLCERGCLDKNLVKGKILLCQSSDYLVDAYEAGAVGLVAQKSPSTPNISAVLPFAISLLPSYQFELAESYYDSNKKPTMNILTSHSKKDKDAPIVAEFSSRGPNVVIPDILKPDIIAPGTEILAAFSPKSSPSDYGFDKRSVFYNILSGTSMSCPHVTGAAAYVKSIHPDWSASAIKSALMTTAAAGRMNTSKSKHGHNEFSYGAGHLDPVKAANPGIVYRTTYQDYINLLCGMNISSSMATKMSGLNITCDDKKVQPLKAKDLNYPSMAAQIEELPLTNNTNGAEFKVKFTRKVTNVGLPNSTYKAKTTCHHTACKINVVPEQLSFKALNEEKSFVVTVAGKNLESMVSASLEWDDGIHVARSPIVVYAKTMSV